MRRGALVALALLIAGGGAARAEMPGFVAAMHQPAPAGDVSVTLLSVDVVSGDAATVKVVLHYSVRNTSSYPIDVATLPAIALEDAAHTPLAASSVTPITDGTTLAPNAAAELSAIFSPQTAAFSEKTWLAVFGAARFVLH